MTPSGGERSTSEARKGWERGGGGGGGGAKQDGLAEERGCQCPDTRTAGCSGAHGGFKYTEQRDSS